MRVLKVINNNIVSCEDEQGRELIAMGRGLGYSLRPGDELESSRVEKLFRMDTPADARRLTDLFSSLPARQVELCSQIVDRATRDLGRRLSPSVYITLTDHVCFAIERQRSGASFPNTLLAEVRTFYADEYKVGKYALELLARELGVYFPDDEAANIALHLVNAEYGNSLSDTLHITQTLHDILSSLDGWPCLRLDPQSRFYDEFTVNLKFLVLRAFSGGNMPPRGDERFVESVRQCYPDEYQCARQLVEGLERRAGNVLAPEESAYLAASLHRARRQP